MRNYLTFALLFSLALSSCIKDELPNTECDIVSAWVEGEQYASNFYHPSQMHLDNISSAEKEIVFSVRSLISLPKKLPVNFTITERATIQPASGSEQDFTKGPVTYVVTSEDGEWKREYKVTFKEATMPTYIFSFETYETLEWESNFYHNFYEISQSGERLNMWASGNPGAVLIKLGTKPEDQPTYSTPDGYAGRGVCLNTQGTGEIGQTFGKPIAAGNLFMGHFIFENVLSQPLKATEFGYAMDREPVRVTGYYKYKPGPVFTDKNMNTFPNRTDEASIYAVFYRNVDSEGNKVFLYGDDVLTSPYIVKKAEVAALPPTDEWTRFEMFFEGQNADDELVQDLGYNLTLVFSSSKEGASFEGSVGSTLYIDEVEVSFELPDND